MNRETLLYRNRAGACLAIAAVLIAGCKSSSPPSVERSPTPPSVVSPQMAEPGSTTSAVGARAATNTVAGTAAGSGSPSVNASRVAVRINAGLLSPFTDPEGNVWLPDQGFADGEILERPGIQITNTANPEIYRSERYSMHTFSRPVPNGKYTVKLHFCETFEGIAEPGERVFSFNVEDKKFENFDPWAKTGGPNRAYIESVDVEVTDGKLDITFTDQAENPQINGLEIHPSQ